MQHAMQQIVQERGSDQVSKLGCFWIPGFPGVELFFCFDRGDSGISPYLFHYSWRGKGDMNEKLHKIESITPKTVVFKDGKTKELSPQLKSHLQWMYKYQNSSPSVRPSEQCEVTGDGVDFNLICNTPNGSPKKPIWTKKIPQNQVEDMKTELATRV